MNLGPQTDTDTIKKSFQAAVMQGDLSSVCSAVKTMQQQKIDLSFMEQIVLLGDLAKLEAVVGYSILNCGAFRQQLILVGMTCLSDFSSEQSPYIVPLVEQELILAAEEKRFHDVAVILDNAKWCISPLMKKWAEYKQKANTEGTCEDIEGINYVMKNYLHQPAIIHSAIRIVTFYI